MSQEHHEGWKIGEYTILTDVGAGSFSFVCKAKNKKGQIFALKFIEKSSLVTETDIVRLKREVETLKKINHQSIVRFYDFLQNQDFYIIVMEYCSGMDLFDYIVCHNKLDEVTAGIIFAQIISAVQYLHSQHIAHRDLKPQNIIVDQQKQIKIIDFGLCGITNDSDQMTSFCGSPCYTSPECLREDDYDGKKRDMWSLGVILYEMLTGQHPWNINNSFLMHQQILTGTYPIPDYLMPDAVDLIKNLMAVIPEFRLSPEQVLNHPWIQRMLRTQKKNQPSILPPLIRRSVSLDLAKICNDESIKLIPQQSSIPQLKQLKPKIEGKRSRIMFSKSRSITPIVETTG